MAIVVLDAEAVEQTLKTTETSGTHVPHHNVDSSALPSGAATAAKQPAFGTAGVPSADIVSIQGVSGGTAIPIDLTVTTLVPGTGASNLGKAEDAASASGDVGVATLAVRMGVPGSTSTDEGDYEALKMRGGRLLTDGTMPEVEAKLDVLTLEVRALLSAICDAFSLQDPQAYRDMQDQP